MNLKFWVTFVLLSVNGFRLVKSKIRTFSTKQTVRLAQIKNNKSNTDKIIGFVFRVKTLWKKGENAGYQHFLLFPTMFHKGCFFYQGCQMSSLWGKKLRLVETERLRRL